MKQHTKLTIRVPATSRFNNLTNENEPYQPAATLEFLCIYDIDNILTQLAHRAARRTTGQATAMHGRIVVKLATPREEVP